MLSALVLVQSPTLRCAGRGGAGRGGTLLFRGCMLMTLPLFQPPPLPLPLPQPHSLPLPLPQSLPLPLLSDLRDERRARVHRDAVPRKVSMAALT